MSAAVRASPGHTCVRGAARAGVCSWLAVWGRAAHGSTCVCDSEWWLAGSWDRTRDTAPRMCTRDCLCVKQSARARARTGNQALLARCPCGPSRRRLGPTDRAARSAQPQPRRAGVDGGDGVSVGAWKCGDLGSGYLLEAPCYPSPPQPEGLRRSPGVCPRGQEAPGLSSLRWRFRLGPGGSALDCAFLEGRWGPGEGHSLRWPSSQAQGAAGEDLIDPLCMGLESKAACAG